jgi:drug/metabolite transporter (DMT)-like permease
MAFLSPNTLGHAYGASAVLILSTDSMLTRLCEDVEQWTLIFWKYFFCMGLLSSMFAVILFKKQKGWANVMHQLHLIGWVGALAACCFCASNMTINYAFLNGNISNTLVILAANPAFTTIWNYTILREIPDRRTLICGAICIACVVYICVEEIVNGGDNDEDSGGIFPILSACCCSFLFALYFVLIRVMTAQKEQGASKEEDGEVVASYAAADATTDESMALKKADNPLAVDKTQERDGVNEEEEPPTLLVNIIASLLSSIVAASFTFGQTSPINALTTREWCFTGLVACVLAVSFSLLSMAPKLISAPEVSLYLLIETVLGPIWVYLAGLEDPRQAALVGGPILLCTLAVNSFMAIWEQQQQQQQPENDDDDGDDDDGGVNGKDMYDHDTASAAVPMQAELVATVA